MITDALLIATVLVSLVTDLLERRIYNALTFPVLLAGILFHAAAGGPWWEGLGGALLVGLPYFGLFALGVMGAGDVKLVMAIGAVGGVKTAAVIGVGSIVAGGILSAAALIVRKRLADVLRVWKPGSSPESSLKVPYGLAIAVATLAWLGFRGLG